MDNQVQLQPPPENLLAPLLELRNYYAQNVEKYEKLHMQAKELLHSVEALLSNMSSHSSIDVPHQVLPAFVEENRLPENSNNITESSPNLVEPRNGLVSQTSNLEISEPSSTPTPPDEQPASASTAVETPTQPNEQPESTSTTVETPTETQVKSGKSSDIPMLEEYQSLSRPEAIQKVLQEYAGGMCHIDMLVRLLYGEMELNLFKVVKGRVQSTLTKGKESAKWFGVPGKPGYYTIDLKSLKSKRTASKKSKTKETEPSAQTKPEDEKPELQVKIEDEKLEPQVKTEDKEPAPEAKIEDEKPSPQAKTKDKKPQPQGKSNGISMQGEFEGKVLIDAISSLLEQNPRKVFDVAKVIEGLYGELEVEQVQEVKPKVLKELSRGNKTGRFSRVPEEKGLYIWDSKALPKEIRK